MSNPEKCVCQIVIFCIYTYISCLKGTRHVCVCVHVCVRVTPCPEEVLLSAGACDTLILSHATTLWIRVGRETWPFSCTCNATVEHAVQLDFLFPWWFAWYSPQTHFQAAELAAAVFLRFLSVCNTCVQHLQFFGLTRLSVPSFISAWNWLNCKLIV